MEFKAVKVENFKGYRKTKLQQFIKDFADSGLAVAEIIWSEKEYKDYNSVQSSLSGTIKKMKKSNIQIKAVDKQVYLINKIIYEQEVKRLADGEKEKESC